jgi:hypothetical protein
VSGSEPSATRPTRPVLVELAAAILVVGGAISVMTSIQVMFRLADQGEAAVGIAAISIGIGLALIVLGVAVRYGRLWLLTLNVVAVIAFLELTSGSIVGLFFGGLDVFVVLALFRERPWFQWRPDVSP